MSYKIKCSCLVFILMFHIRGFSAPNLLNKTEAVKPFITVWKSDNPGTSSSTQITIPTTGAGYNYNIYWAKTTNESVNGKVTGVKGNYTITFPAAGTYRVEISGSFPRIYFYDSGDNSKILSVNQWGSIAWESMALAFHDCSNLTIPATDAPDLSKVTDMSSMFIGASSFNQPIGHWDVSKVTNMAGLFSSATSFNKDISNWKVDSVTNMMYMFYDAPAYNQPMGKWNVGKVTNMSAMFWKATSFNQPIGEWNVSKVGNMSSMFSEATSFNQPLGNWNVGQVTSIIAMFNGAISFNQDLSNWNVSKVILMERLFSGATNFNSPLNSWNVSNVQSMISVFTNAVKFNQPIGNWNTGNVLYMNAMFSGASSFNQDISNWNVSKVQDMLSMFDAAGSFNKPLSSWNVSNVTIMRTMFLNAVSFNQPIGNWDVKKVTDMDRMFSGAVSFNQDISNWNVGNVTKMPQMFMNAGSFNQNIGKWDIKNVTTMILMLNGSMLSTVNYDLTIKGWISNPGGLKQNVNLGAGGLKYCAGDSARQALIKNYTWTISGDVKECSQTINFGILESKSAGDPPFNLSATSSTGMSVIYTSSDTSVAKVSGNTVTIISEGSTTITASVLPGNYYSPAAPVQQILNVGTITDILKTENFSVKIYPVPANDYLEIEVDGKPINTLSLHDLNGKNVLNLGTGSQRADISNLNSGVYILNAGTPDKNIHLKIVKE